MNKGISSNYKDGCFSKKHILCFALFLGSVDVFAEDYESLILNQSGYWQDININNITTTNGALLVKDGASVNLKNTDITVGLISGTGIKINKGSFTAEYLKINVKDSKGKALGINIGPSSQVNLKQLTLINQGKGDGIVFNNEEKTPSGLILSDSSIETTNGTGIRSMFGLVTLSDVNILARGDFAHAIDMNTGTQELTIRGGEFSTEGDESYGIWMIHDGGTMLSDGMTIKTLGERSHGVVLQRSDSDLPLSEAIISNSSFAIKGDNAYGIYTEGEVHGHQLSIDTTGESGHGLVAIGEATAFLEQSNITTHNDFAYGLAAAAGSHIEGKQISISTEGESSHGLYSDRGSLILSDSNINVQGKNASGLLVGGDGSKGNLSYTEMTQLTPFAVMQDTSLHSVAGSGISSINGASAVKLTNSVVSTKDGNAFTARTITDNQQNTRPSALYIDATDSTILGNINAMEGSKIYADLKGEKGVLTGQLTNVESLNLQGSLWNITGSSQLKTLNNNGNIIFEHGNTDHQLIIDGDYSGSGTLKMLAILAGDHSPVNKVIIKGDVLAGSSTAVSVENLGGLGADTVKGIELISVGGTSYGQFTQKGRIVAGAYEYNLVKQAQSWYLQTDLTESETKPDPRPSPTYRVEGGSYLANFIAGNTLFNTSLFERESDPFEHEISAPGKNTSNLWLRQVGGRSSWSDSSGQLTTKSNRYVAQLGGALLQLETPAGGRWSTGVMAGYGHHNNSTASHRVDYRAKGSVNGYSTGLYSTWINDNSGKGGYIDSWLLYNWFNNSVKGDQLSSQSYHSKGLTGSIEAGYISEVLRFNGSLGSEYRWYFMPSAQLVYQGVKQHDFIEANKTRISNVGKNNIQSKLGLRSWIRGRHQKDQQTERYFQPFAELNWIHNSKTHGVKMDSTKVELAGAENMAEMKLGLEANLSSQGSVWVNTAVQLGNQGYNDNRLTLGGKWHF